MAIITKPLNIQKGESIGFLLNKPDLEAHPNVVADAYYSNPVRWRYVQLVYKSPVNNQRVNVYFDYSQADPIQASFITSDFVTNDFEIEALNIYDFDGGIFSIYREDLTVSEFDVSLIDSFGVKSYKFTNAAESVYEGGVTISTHHTQSLWFKANTPSTGVEARLLSIGDQTDILLYKNAANELRIYVNSASPVDRAVLPTVDIFDGDWHSVVVGYSASFDEVTVFVDGFKEQVITGLTLSTNNNTYIGNVGASQTLTPNSVGIDGWIAQAETWSTYFTTAMALEHYNEGQVLNPAIHTEAANLVNNWTFGDNVGDDGSTVIDEQGNGNLTTYDAQGSTVTLLIEDEHPGI